MDGGAQVVVSILLPRVPSPWYGSKDSILKGFENKGTVEHFPLIFSDIEWYIIEILK